MSNGLDRFNRANTDSQANSGLGTLGIADSGQSWSTSPFAFRWQIIGNQAGRPEGAAGQAIAWIDCGSRDGFVEATIIGAGYIGILCRVIDDNNHFLMQALIGGNGACYGKFSGAYGSTGGFPPGTVSSGDRLGIRVKGNRYICYRNGIPGTEIVLGASVLDNAAATKFGIYNYNAATCRHEDFSVKLPVMKTHDGTSHVARYAKEWDGSKHVIRAVRRWDGTRWV